MSVLRAAQGWVKVHPYQTTTHILNGLIVFYPMVATIPTLFSLGFRTDGPHWPASTYMSRNGRIEPGSLFATLQSAAMGGAGSIAVAKTAQTGAVLSSITLAYRTYLRGKR
ncbi:hypothetical protein HBI56_174220 [Parastagonospora nodorum]|uniref:Uncharacterized protein n=2 Tax=Phaeosphaeria nodorum (strain SN15 / ATCC MYA-4574 / FGSC 10173) TaxID=321614 RepID=A0A7U2I6X9_PHANO|nr:hypothetical protein SNOG_13880 [Parastagonospora nodorum SN15]KAH3911955.1 hypothetical protein HBH56_119690 [Parastagonospora nodorum]EAT78904.1 hypothetical protein SNOG_13880 [Parastagonospora nodorum SN15]KAH3924265.1 hypothetical protein HBH54_195590 [Parastagonospora nodorum]KAH3942480.1 hypothetical protein HBH53_187910 [Parastagonospora nodorum]KAH3956701.1 hypothetical protein HBH51_236910 [Parastagonospora nodorum]